MYDNGVQSRALRWSSQLKTRLNVREVLDLPAVPCQRSPVEDAPSPPDDR